MIDFHTHIYPDALAPRALKAAGMNWPFQTDAGLAGQLRLMEQYHIRKCAALCIANRPDEQENVNRFAMHIQGAGGGRIAAFGSVHPYAKDAAETIERLYGAGIRGIKFQPMRQRFQADEDVCRPLYRKIGELGMICVFHCGRDVRENRYHVLPEHMERIVGEFAGGPVICAHMGGAFLKLREMRRLAALPVYVDTALSAWYMGQAKFNAAVELFGPRRVLFGTDMPWAAMDRELDYIRHLPLSEEDKERILDGNAQELLDRCT